MAETHGTPQAGTAEPELRIEIWPRGDDTWIGTSAQLVAEGLIPQDFKWPVAFSDRMWTDGPFDYWLTRTRPEGAKGPKSSFVEVDHWRLRRRWAAYGRDGYGHAHIHEKRIELQHAIWKESPEGMRQSERFYFVVQSDKAFQSFRARIPALNPPKRGRKAAG